MIAARYTADEKAQVAELLREGLSASKIAARLGDRSRNAVIGLIHRDPELRAIGFKGRPFGAKDVLQPRTVPAPKVKTNVRAAAATAGQIVPRILRRATAKGLEPQIATPGSVALVDLREGQCRFPMGDPRDPDFGFCGLPRHDVKRSYCIDHLRRAYSRPVCEAVA